MSRFFSIIPARIGSKGILKKNLYPLNGKPLLHWTIESSLKSKNITKTIVSSDSEEIFDSAKYFDIDLHERGKVLSNDIAKSESVIVNILEENKNIVDDFDYLILLQPTSPLRNSNHIDKACEIILNDKSESLMSVKEVSNSCLKALIHDGNRGLRSAFDPEFPFLPRQQLPKTFMPNGAIYICKIDYFLKNHNLLADKNSFYIMDDEVSVDIDTYEDLQTIEALLKKKNKTNT